MSDGQLIYGAGEEAFFVPVAEPLIYPRAARLVITVATGKSRDMLRASGLRMKAYAQSVGADFIALTNHTQSWPLAEKWRLGYYAAQYERTLFVDADVCIRPCAPDIFAHVPRGTVGIHNDWPDLERWGGGSGSAKSTRWVENELRYVGDSQGVTIPKGCLNSGVIIHDREDADIWEPPPHPFPLLHCAEQHWNQFKIMTRKRVFSLGSEWNFQFWANRDFRNVDEAHFVHLAGMGQLCPDLALPMMRALCLP